MADLFKAVGLVDFFLTFSIKTLLFVGLIQANSIAWYLLHG